jgi:chemotaxis protein methyltransferase CheR
LELKRLSQQQFQRFREFIYRECGIRIDENKITLLSNRIRRRLKAGDFKDFDDYYRFLTSPTGAAELGGFLDAITTNETFFFRTEKHFKWFGEDFLTEMVARHRDDQRPPSLRVWSAGCASGAEPYTLAMCLAANMYRLRDWSLKILGTDISEEALSLAQEGVFKPRAIEAVDDSLRRRYFQQKAEDRWQVRSEIRELVEFKRHNLMRPLLEPPHDCIFIRNVLIYFDRDSKGVVVRNLLSALAPGGYLVVGPSEGIYDMLAPLQRITPFLYQKVDTTASRDAAGTQRNAQR